MWYHRAMKPKALTCFAAASMLLACGAPAAANEVTLADHSAALSDQANDLLFVITWAQLDKPFAAADLRVTAGSPGGSQFVLNWEHDDANQDGKIDRGEPITCREPGSAGVGGLANIFDAATVGKTVNVDVTLITGASTATQLAALKWTPAN